MLWANVERRLDAAGRLLEHTEIAGLSNSAKSSYYRSAILLLCSVAEGMVYELVKKHTTPPNHVIETQTVHVERHRIPSRALSTANDLCICEKTKKGISIDDDGVVFGRLNLFLKHRRIVTEREYNQLNWARLERNKVHLQGLNTPDTGYTRAKIEKIAKAILMLEDKLH